MEIDQDQGPLGEHCNASCNWSLELEQDRARPNALERQCLEAHPTPSGSEHDDGNIFMLHARRRPVLALCDAQVGYGRLF
jgi:hypothetical protein